MKIVIIQNQKIQKNEKIKKESSKVYQGVRPEKTQNFDFFFLKKRNRAAIEVKNEKMKKNTPKPWTPKVAFRPSGVLLVSIG